MHSATTAIGQVVNAPNYNITYATTNPSKVDGLYACKGLFEGNSSISPLPEGYPEIEEIGNTTQENSLIKAVSCLDKVGGVCLADDVGFGFPAFNGWPGIFAHREEYRFRSPYDYKKFIANGIARNGTNSMDMTISAALCDKNTCVVKTKIVPGFFNSSAITNASGFWDVFVPKTAEKENARCSAVRGALRLFKLDTVGSDTESNHTEL
jgi:inosine/xanthosine triphosphate pyrophosphatase family protein